MDVQVIKPSEGFEYYNPGTIFWNNFQYNSDRESRAISGSTSEGWIGYTRNRYGKQAKGLFVSCGNGWVERACFTEGLISEAHGFDISPELINIAEAEAKQIDMPAIYTLADGNNLALDVADFNIVVNNGSMHHIAYLDRLLRYMHTLMKPDGLYVIMDYTGPHRNQYSWECWSRSLEINARLPQKYRKQLRYTLEQLRK